MVAFLLGIAMLVTGYFTYGKLVEHILEPDDRATPAVEHPDGVDYVVLPQWKNMLIQLLNIAGIGPVIGVILGIKFGSIVFLLIPIGNLIAGATHDFIGGMMSLRDNGANLPKLIRTTLGRHYANVFQWFMVVLLLLVVAVFINIPAHLAADLCPADSTGVCGISWFWSFVVLIFLYYIAATLFPVDKIIGSLYPYFGAALLLGTGALFVMLLARCVASPTLLLESAAFRAKMFTEQDHPILPMLFVTIACGIISGFHATQSPIIARTMKSEWQARASFYGMMVVEGIIAMIWAGGALVVYNLKPELMNIVAANVLRPLTTEFLGPWIGGLTVFAVIVLAITSGDTAMRSLRLSLAEGLKVPQKSVGSRILVTIPLILVVCVLLWWSNLQPASFGKLWNYFAWANQVLAASTLMAGAVWLFVRNKNALIALLPGCFMTYIVMTYILWASPEHHQAYGFGLPLSLANIIGAVIAYALALFTHDRAKHLKKLMEMHPEMKGTQIR